MGADVLVLNKSFYAIQITSWKRALTLLYLDQQSERRLLVGPVDLRYLGELSE